MRAPIVALALLSLAVPTVADASRKPTKSERAAIKAAARSSKLTKNVDCFRTTDIRISTKGPWAAAVLRACKKESTDAAAAVLRKKADGSFKLKALGTSFVGCDLVSKAVAQDLKLFC